MSTILQSVTPDITIAYENMPDGSQAERVVAVNSAGAAGLTDAEMRAAPIDVSLSVPALSSDAASSVASSETSATLIVANASRKSLTIFNNSTAILYVAFGATSTQSGAKVAIGAGGFYEMPSPAYTGVVSGIWASANGNASIYEGV